MKKVVGLLVIVFTAACLPAVQANQKPTVVVIDNAIDTTKINVIHEACVMQELRCPNKTTFMEGPGAASLPVSQIYKNGFNHGTIMTTIASAVGRDINIIFVRIVPMTNTGKQGFYGPEDVIGALKWVAANKTKFNVVAVSASFGTHKLGTGASYCPVNNELKAQIVNLQGLGVATIFAAGNNYDKERVDFPACISESVAVGSVNMDGYVELYSNGGVDLDFYSLGTYNTSVGRAMGTSAATAAFAAYWAKNYKGSYQTTYDYLKSIAKPVPNDTTGKNIIVDILK
jgi:hypothetical protein